MRRIIKITAWAFALFLIYFSGVLLHGGMTDYQPEAVLPVELEQQSELGTIRDSIITLTSWNIGYSGLGAEADFFYHGSGFFLAGGDMVYPPEELSKKYFEGAQDYIASGELDFYLLQEVDFDSKRSYYVDQFSTFKNQLPGYSASKVTNFKVERVPAPVLQPWKAYGQASSGLATYSKFQPTEVTRYQLPGDFSWPNKPFMLDRCLQVSRYPIGDKELVVVNLHNTAYERDGVKKMQQLDFLEALIVKEFDKGNFVIAGGDWNQCPPGITKDHYTEMDLSTFKNTTIPADQFPAGWQWAFDAKVPSNRSTREPYVPGETFTQLIDFFLISPNIELLDVQTIDQKFAYSDHQPVEIQVRLK